MRRLILLLAIGVLLAACGGSALDVTTTTVAATTTVATTVSTTAATTSTTAAPTTTAAATTTTAAPTTTAAATTTTTLPWGPAAADCINGWITPEPGSVLWETGLSHLGVHSAGAVTPDDFAIDDMRYFVGPEDANILSPLRDVERWYIKGSSISNPAFQSRFITRRVDVGAGLAWVAPYNSTGFGPGLWEDCYDSDRTGNVAGNFCTPGFGFDPFSISCAAFTPGAWTRGDCFGLPPEVLGCVAGL